MLCYVDDILCMSKNAKEVMEELQKKFKFKKDLIAPPDTYLGAGLTKKEIDGYTVWAISSVAYVKAAVKNVQKAIKDKPWKLPKRAPTPMTQSFIPELDDSPELNDNERAYYQELIGVLRWATELGRIDILREVSLLSQYQACPRKGHMQEIMQLVFYSISYRPS